MNNKRNLLVSGIRRALLVGLAGGMGLGAGTTFAQDDQDAKELEAIEVTGSRIRRADMETASPVQVIEAAAIERTGAINLGDVIQEVPSIAGAATNASVNNGGGDGRATVSLRGLGEVRTLLLLNGHRVNYDDLNSIPIHLVDRIEILKDGASAIYGSDAIGGVVNIILKRDIEGGSVTVNYGVSGEDDGERQGITATYGTSGERGNFIVSAAYNDQEEISAADRDYSSLALTLSSGVVTIGGSSRTTTGWYAVPREVAAAGGVTCGGTSANVNLTRIDGRPGTAISDFKCFEASDLFNYQAVGNLQLTPQERTNFFASSTYNVTDTITAYADIWGTQTSSYGRIAPLPFDGRPANDNIVLSADSIYNPFGVDIIDSRLRLSRIGDRQYDFDTDAKQMNFGLKGGFGDTSWTWDAFGSYGKLEQEAATTGYLLTSALADALGPSFIQGGVARCGTPEAPIANCVPVDFFGAPPDPNSPTGAAQLAALAGISPNTTNRTSQSTKQIALNFQGEAFELPAGVVGTAIGLEWREQNLAFDPDFLAQINTQTFTCLISSEACTSPTSGSVETKEVYGEAFVPLLADAPLAERLDMTLGVRWSDYDTFGSTTNYKIGIEWKPIEDVLVRSTYASVFRAPTITNLFAGNFASSDGFNDPCNGFTGAPNPACTNVPNNGEFNQTDSQLSAIKGGNPFLEPEEGGVFTWGAVYSPEWLEGFDMNFDVWRVHLEKTIGTFGTQNILNACFSSTIANPSPFCALFSRDANGEMVRLFDVNDNVGETVTKGVDIGFRYELETDFGNFRNSLETTYVDEFNVKTIVDGEVVGAQFNAGTFLTVANGGLGNYSRWRAQNTLRWNLGNWEAQWNMRYIHGFAVGSLRNEGPCADAALPPGSDGCKFTRGATTYHNAQVGYNFEDWNTKVNFGIRNLGDKQPPILYQNNTLNGNTDERTFDTIGRYYWANVTYTF